MKADGQALAGGAGAARAVPRQGAGRGLRRAYVPPVSDGSGQDRNLLRRADALLREAGCKRDGSVLEAAGRQAVRDRVPRLPGVAAAAYPAVPGNLKRLGIEARSRIVDAAQYQRRMEEFDFDMAVDGARRGADAGRRAPRSSSASEAASDARLAQPRRHRRSGRRRADRARSRKPSRAAKLNVAGRALDRVLRAGRYWVPMWYEAERLGRLLGHVRAARDASRDYDLRRAGHLVVRRREGESDRTDRRLTRRRQAGGLTWSPISCAALLLMIPTLFGIMLDLLRHRAVRARRAGRAHHRAAAGQRLRRDGAHLGGGGGDFAGGAGRGRGPARRRPRRAIAARRGSIREFIKQLEKQFGFDKPAHERFCMMLWDYAALRFRQELFPRRLGARS